MWQSSRKLNKGFTLAEMVVTVGIMSVILTILVVNQSSYTDRSALSNLADDIGLSLSQAQAYGIGVKEFTPGSSEFSDPYGLTFSLLASGSNTAYIYFGDRNANGIYDNTWSCTVGGASECTSKTDITRGNYISSMCIVRSSGADVCNVGRMDITFKRPNPEAQILFFNMGGSSYSLPNTIGARIILTSPKSATSSVIIYNTGQISVQ